MGSGFSSQSEKQNIYERLDESKILINKQQVRINRFKFIIFHRGYVINL
jgi:hypothetical protein